MAEQDSRIEAFMPRNEKYAETHTPKPLWSDLAKMLNPAGAMIIVSCFDPRQDPRTFFGLQPGEAAIIANAGGRVDADVIRSIIGLDALADAKGGVTSVIVAHHTDCGLTHIKDDEIKAILKERAPAKNGEIDGLKFGEITDLKQAVIDDMEVVKASPYLRKDLKVLGYLFDITSGKVEEIKA